MKVMDGLRIQEPRLGHELLCQFFEKFGTLCQNTVGGLKGFVAGNVFEGMSLNGRFELFPLFCRKSLDFLNELSNANRHNPTLHGTARPFKPRPAPVVGG
jgi:hypothetical protein